MRWSGKLRGAALGLLVGGPIGAALGALAGHLMADEDEAEARIVGDPQAVATRFFRTTFEVMGHVAKADGRVSEREIRAALAVMDAFRLEGAQRQFAIEAFRVGKRVDYPLSARLRNLYEVVAARPDLLRMFLEIQVRAAIEGSDVDATQLPRAIRSKLGGIATALGVSAAEFAHLEALLRQDRRAASRSAGLSLEESYRVLGVPASASDEQVVKAYRRQLSRHHPDKLKANGLPESMLGHAQQRTRQIIEAWDLIREQRGISS